MVDPSPWIFAATAATFEQDVLARSESVPIVLDFWAPWCGPCRQLTPLLEKLVEEYRGKFLLAKVNVDEEQELAGAFGVQSIPLVVALHQQQLVDQFMGLMPEDDLRRWLDRLVPSPAQLLVGEGLQLEPTDPKGAEAKYRQALELVEEDDAIRIHLARALLRQNRLEESRTLIERLRERGWLEPDAEKIASELDVLLAARDTGGIDAARRAAEADPDNLRLKLPLVDALAAGHQYEEAFELCLEIIRRDRDGAGVEAKETMVKIFDMLGPAAELTGIYRRKLATLLY